MVAANNYIAVHHQLTSHCCTSSTDKPQHWVRLCSVPDNTSYFQRLTLESWYTNLEQTPINRCQQLPAPYKSTGTKSTNGRLTDRLNSTNNRQTKNRPIWPLTMIWLTIDRSKPTNDWWQTFEFHQIPSLLNWPIIFNGADLQHHRLSNSIHLTLKMTCAQVVETSVTNNSSFQNYPHLDDH